MKNKLIIFILTVIMVGIVAGCAPGTVPQINTTVPNTQKGTPSPNGDINVPGFSVQLNLPGPNPQVNQANANGRVAGILLGIWHGIISPVTLVVSFINPDVHMYEVHNDGSQYNFGFLLGVAIVFLFLGASAGRRRH